MHTSLAMLLAMLSVVALLAVGCDRSDPEQVATQADRSFAVQALVVDTHIDVPYRIDKEFENVAKATDGGDFDWVRAKEGGLDVAFMSIYVPSAYQLEGGAREHADHLIDMMEELAARNPDKFAVTTSVADSRAAARKGLVALPLGMENGAGIEDRLDLLAHFYQRGVRYITLTHSKANLICDSSYDKERPWGGLSSFGVEVVREMNRLGIMVDISHVSDEAFYDVLEVTEAPVIASHSSARHFTPGWERNMSDPMIEALAKQGGVIQINYGSTFLTREARAWSDQFQAERDALIEQTGWDKDGEEVKAWAKKYREAQPFPYATLDDVLDHIDHVVAIAGIEHVGIGSDYDGVGDSLPIGLKDVSTYPALVGGLRKRGYSDEDIRLLLGENLMRVWSEVERLASTRAAA